jgi:Predicted glycosyltransferases
MNDILAGIVLYNPDLGRLRENLSHICKQVFKVVCVDNGSQNIEEIKDLLNEFENVEIVEYAQNKGIACALNEVVRYGEKEQSSWMLTLDQDSVCDDKLIEVYRNYIKENDCESVGCLTCNIKDRNFNATDILPENQDILYCITSGSLMNLNAMRKIGYFDEYMFIDKVDIDVCINLRMHGYRIVKLAYAGLLHEIGHARQINLGIRMWEIYNHSPFRRYYMCRNASYLLVKYRSVYTLSFFEKEIFQTILVFFLENDKIAKLKAAVIGFVKGFLKR